MTYLYLFFGAICAGVALIAATTASRARGRATVQRVHAAIDYGIRAGNGPGATDVSVYLDNEPRQGLVSKVATWLGGLLSGRFTAVGEEAIREQLMSAGLYTVSPRTVLGYRVLTTIGLPVIVFLLTGLHSVLDVAMIALGLFAGWVLPLTYVQRKARMRIDTLDRSLPDLIDLLCVMIEAGLSFPAAMRLAAEQFAPPLSDELRLTLQEQTMGLGIDEALAHLAERADTPAMKAFVRAMAQGEKMGISTGQIMRNLAHEMRNRRRSQAEERAQKTPVLMLFPLVFLIFPAMFIILMTPAVISMVHNLKAF
ncbi:MAG TPA: type II secretion system F family protein [Solirubrobacteraceae bacterium]|jgi:tight adherence protein C|nr:type II secretion system F family protein [Solirubrobacteraceae bacterium]